MAYKEYVDFVDSLKYKRFVTWNCQKVDWIITCVSWCGTRASCFQCVRRVTTSGRNKRRPKVHWKHISSRVWTSRVYFCRTSDLRGVTLLSDDGGLKRRIFRSFETFTYCQTTEGLFFSTNMADFSFEESFSLEDFEAQVIENAAAVPNVDNLTTCSCRGYCLREKGRNYCPCKSNNSFCSSACHGADYGYCMNNRRVQDDSNETTVRLYYRSGSKNTMNRHQQ